MSLRYASKVVLSAWVRVKDQTSKCDSVIKCSRDSFWKQQARRFSAALDSPAFKAAAKDVKYKRAEESLRTVMYVSGWAHN